MNKRDLLLKQKRLLATFALSTALLCGCRKDYSLLVNSSTIVYEENNMQGCLLYDDLEFVLIADLEKDNIIYTKLVYKKTKSSGEVLLYDLETGSLLEDYQISNSECILKYLVMDNNIRFEYDISEIIDLYHNLLDDNKLIRSK